MASMRQDGADMTRAMRAAEAAAQAEAEFHALVAELAREALGRGEPTGQIGTRIIRFFLNEPTLRSADPHEQERVVARMQRVIEDALALGPLSSNRAIETSDPC
jgi:hypothetical protein